MDDNAYAIMEGEMIVAVDEYIAARPQLDSTHNRRIYEAGFRTAWNRRAEAVPEGWKLLKDTTQDERSWTEDSTHENGNYYQLCCHCGRQFIGHKRRVVCKSCAMLAAAPEVKHV